MNEEKITAIIEKQEVKRALSALQADVERQGLIPENPLFLLRKLSVPLHYGWGFILGVYAGIFSVFISFIVALILFHL